MMIPPDSARASRLPCRIVCLTAESVDILYALEAGDLVVGVSGYTVTPEEARRKPKVGAYTSVDFEKIFALTPDLVIACSDLQADITATLARRGATVLHLNQRSLRDILAAIAMIGAIVGRGGAAGSRDRFRVVVRKESPTGTDRRAPWLGPDDGGARGADPRNQIGPHPPARPGDPARDATDGRRDRRLGSRSVM